MAGFTGGSVWNSLSGLFSGRGIVFHTVLRNFNHFSCARHMICEILFFYGISLKKFCKLMRIKGVFALFCLVRISRSNIFFFSYEGLKRTLSVQ